MDAAGASRLYERVAVAMIESGEGLRTMEAVSVRKGHPTIGSTGSAACSSLCSAVLWGSGCRDAALFRATGMRLSELAGIRYAPMSPGAATLTCGAGRSPSVARAARPGSSRLATTPCSLDWYIRVRAGHAQASRPHLGLGINIRSPMIASGIYQVIAGRGREGDVELFPH
jgi:hypothetical protein